MEIIKSNVISLHGAAVSMQGGRPENQDDMAWLDTPLGFLIIVCDGMGGGPGGKTASYVVKYEIATAINDCTPQTPRDHAFKMAVARAHASLEEKMKENPALNGMGSTFVAILINKHSAIVAHAGDSRCYKLHGAKCLYRSVDHSLVAELVKKKVMTEEEARQSPQSNVVTRGLGSTSNHVPEIEEIPYKKGDRFVLCSDGVWGIMPHQDLLKALTAQVDIQKLVADMSAQIDNIGFSQGGGHDNYTLAVFEMDSNSEAPSKGGQGKVLLISVAALLMAVVVGLGIWYIASSLANKNKRDVIMYQPADDVSPRSSLQDGNRYASTPNGEDSSAGSGTQKVVQKNNPGDSTRQADSKGILKNESGTDIGNSELENRITQKVREKQIEDSTAVESGKQDEQKETVKKAQQPKPSEVAVDLIDKYKAARNVRDTTAKGAQKKMSELQKEIVGLLDKLCSGTQGSAHQTAEALKRAASNPKSWYISEVPDREKATYGPTPYSLGEIDKQIKRIKDLKKKL